MDDTTRPKPPSEPELQKPTPPEVGPPFEVPQPPPSSPSGPDTQKIGVQESDPPGSQPPKTGAFTVPAK